ncbi:MAG: 4-hydroxythreonine-4-phosphate dehydrogenase PdxA, partial [Acidobacteriota bacterium]
MTAKERPQPDPRNSIDNRPIVGITTGDPAGIGPEISLKAVADQSVSAICRPVLIGDARFLSEVKECLDLAFDLTDFGESSDIHPGKCEVIDLANLPESPLIGVESAAAGRAAGEYIIAAVDLWKNGRIDAIATAPINKRSLSLGGYEFPGHTEFFAQLTGTDRFAMSFFAGELRVVLLSTHVSLRNAIDAVTIESLSDLIEFTDRELSRILGKRVSIAVAGLNPHASENGMFGGEEAATISPAIHQCREKGIIVSGPFSPDTIFLRGFKGEFDAVVACYHDQATIAVKSLSFGSSVNVTLG